MSLDFLLILACCILGLMAHGSRNHPWLGWLLRAVIVFFVLIEFAVAAGWDITRTSDQWGQGTVMFFCILTGLSLFIFARKGLSWLLSCIEYVASGRLFIALSRKESLKETFRSERIFLPESMPHLIGLFVYLTAACVLLASVNPEGFELPALPLPFPVPVEQLFSYNGLGLVLLAFCGVGLFVSRRFREAMSRLGWAKPKWSHVGIAVALIFFTFAYDWAWSVFTHQTEGVANQVARYNAGTFTMGGGAAGPSAFLALCLAIFAGVGEETLTRGALQPVFGIIPAAFLHGVLHGQFSHAPIFILQIFGWSAVMGIVRRYTNTTTTIIAHVGFNFITTFLFSFNP